MANSEVMKAYEKERIRLKAATGKFLAIKEPSHCFHMLMQHVFGMRAELNSLIECLSRPDRRVDDDAYFKVLIHHLQTQISMLCAGMPGITIDENGRVHGDFLSKPGRGDFRG